MKTDTRKKIISYIKKHERARAHDLVEFLGLSRVAIHKQLKQLVETGALQKIGSSPRVFYTLVFAHQAITSPSSDNSRLAYKVKNWSTDTTQLKKDPQAYRLWQLQQLINYGLNGQKLKRSDLLKYWDKLDIESASRRYLAFLLWPEKKSTY
jgi:biotin operon repressor